MTGKDSLAPGGGSFPATRWSVVAAVRSKDPQVRSCALEALSAAYWKPVYKYVRLKFSKDADESQDLTQGFFAELLERDLLARFDAQKSRLRTYLRLCVDSFVLNEIKHSGRQKRGGEAVHLALDFPAAEGEFSAQTIDPRSIASPEDFAEFFEREWIRGLFSASVEDLKEYATTQGRQLAFELFQSYDLEESDQLSYAQLAAEYALAVSEVNNQLAWARREFRRLARNRLRALCATEEEYRREAKALFGGND